MNGQKKPSPTPQPGWGKKHESNSNQNVRVPTRDSVRNDTSVSQQQPFTSRPAPTPKSK